MRFFMLRFWRSTRNVLIPDGTRTNAPASQVAGSGTAGGPGGPPPPANKFWPARPATIKTRNMVDFFMIFVNAADSPQADSAINY
jgi:hypothetical protein